MTAAHTHTQREPGKTFAQALPRLESYGINATYCNWVMCGVVVGVGEYEERPSQSRKRFRPAALFIIIFSRRRCRWEKENNWATQKCPVEKYFFWFIYFFFFSLCQFGVWLFLGFKVVCAGQPASWIDNRRCLIHACLTYWRGLGS